MYMISKLKVDKQLIWTAPEAEQKQKRTKSLQLPHKDAPMWWKVGVS